MTFTKKILATAIVGGLFASAAQAQVNINNDDTTWNPARYASEIIAGPGAARVNLTAGTFNQMRINFGYNFSPAEVRYARVECTSGVELTAPSVAATTNAGTIASIFGAINGTGTNAISFSVTSPASPNQIEAAETFDLAITPRISSVANDINCTYSLYDQPSQAANGGSAGLISTSVATAPYLIFRSGYRLAVTAQTATANVEVTPAFSQFVNTGVGDQTEADNNTAHLADVTYGTATTQARLANGNLGVFTDFLATAAGTGSTITINGDFSAAANSDGTFTGAASRVYISDVGICDPAFGGNITATAVSATAASFPSNTALGARNLCFAPRRGTTSATNAVIPASTYTATLNAVSAAPTTYAVTNRGPSAAGEIVRNGTQLQAPLAQIPPGYLSRVVLTNTGSVARPYTISAQGEAGTTFTAGAAATGSIPANGTVVLNVADIVTITGATRGTLNATVAGPNSQIQGLYQIVNPATGSISNETMIRPGTN